MKSITRILLALVLFIQFTACTRELFQIENANTPTGNFRHIWQDFSENYGLFAVKGIDWDSVYAAHSGQIDDQTGAAVLYTHVTEMLATLNDRHISLYPATNPELPSWGIDLDASGSYVLEDYNWDVVKNNYLEELEVVNPVIQFARLNEAVGFLHIQHFAGTRQEYVRGMDAALDRLGGMKALIVDIRDNSGGYDPNAQYVAGRLAAAEALYMTTRKKNGKGPDDFAETREWYVRPEGKSQFVKPIILLTSSTTASAAETFTLAMRTQPHIRQMGTTTAGSFSDNPAWEAPNGWMYTISVGDFRAADGKSYEGTGLVPELYLSARREDWVAGKDVQLEKALELLP